MIPAIFPKLQHDISLQRYCFDQIYTAQINKKENRCIKIEEKMCLHNLQHKSTTGACLGGTINNK